MNNLNDLVWNNEKGYYEGTTKSGDRIIVDADVFSESFPGDKAGLPEATSVTTWENCVDGKSVRVVRQE